MKVYRKKQEVGTFTVSGVEGKTCSTRAEAVSLALTRALVASREKSEQSFTVMDYDVPVVVVESDVRGGAIVRQYAG